MSDILVLLEVLKRQLEYTEDDGMMYVADLAIEEIKKLRAIVVKVARETRDVGLVEGETNAELQIIAKALEEKYE